MPTLREKVNNWHGFLIRQLQEKCREQMPTVPHHQPEENQHYGPTYRHHPNNQHWRTDPEDNIPTITTDKQILKTPPQQSPLTNRSWRHHPNNHHWRTDPKDTTSTITIGEQILEVVDKVTYLGSTISNNLSLDAELNVRIDKASTIMVRLLKRVLDNTMLTFNIKMRVYQACVLSTLLYGSESWLYIRTKSKDWTLSTCKTSVVS